MAGFRLEGTQQYRFVGGSTWAPGCVADPYTLAFADMVLDLDDPATRGCLLELVRKARGPLTVTYVHDQRWRIWSHDRWLDGYHESEVAALVAALEEP
ncbi:MAG: hypothetical protein FJ100_23500 [Deltaproteobacteria bacterium]|nr:hypothetical protein [Deltaproteobacteria bacterium]